MSVIVNESVQSVIVQGDRSQVVVDEILQSVVVQETAQELVVRTAWPEGARKGANTDITSLTGITGAISEVDSIQFDIDAGITPVEGQISWNQDYSTVDIGMNGGDVVQHVGFYSFYRIKATAAITKGQVVMFTGSVGASGLLTGAPASGVTDPKVIMGIASENMALNDFGEVIAFGLARGFDTSGGAENWPEGDVLYLNPSVAGGLTKTEPAAPNPKVVIAAVVYPTASNSGSIFVRVTYRPRIGELSNVDAGSAVAGSVLIYDAAQTRWEAATLTAGDNVTITNANGAITIEAIGAEAGVDSFNTRTGAVTLTSQDVTDALTFTPYNATNPDGYITGNQTITLSGDTTGSGTTAITTTLANTAVSAGSYGSATQVGTFTVDSKGRLTAAGNTTIAPAFSSITGTPTTLSGYGITDAIPSSEKGAANGVATLGADSKITSSQVPAIAITDTFVVANEAAMLALSTAEKGDVAVRTDVNKSFILTAADYSTLANWQELLTPTDAVTSVNGQTGVVSLSASDVSAVPTTRNVSTGTGLSGGGDLSTDRTLALADTAVTPNSYGSATQVATFTVDQQGRLTAASNATIAIANTAVSGLGTMSTQDANNVAITGGSVGAVTYAPAATATPANNGDMVFELTDNNTLTIKVKGSDGTVRVVALTLTTTAESFLRLE